MRVSGKAVVSGMVGLILFVSCSQEPTKSADSTGDPDWTVHLDEEAGFEITYPSEWLPKKSDLELPEGTVFVVEVFPEDRVGVSVSLLVQKLPGVESDGAGISQAADEVRPLFEPRFVVTDEVNMVVSGRDAVIFYLDGGMSDEPPFTAVHLITIDQTIGWSVNCTAGSILKSLLDAEMEICDKAIRTFKLTG